MNKYELFTNTAYMDYNGNDEVEIAKIVDSESKETVFFVYYSKTVYCDEGYHLCPVVYANENNEILVVKVDDIHRECLYSQPSVFLSMVLHEYAHYINGDLNETELTTKQIQEKRSRCILEGSVMDIELKADAFAISHVGKNTFMRSMDYMIKKRRERGDRDMQLAIQEFELRKKAARKL